MRYTDSIYDFFRSPQWAMNILFGALCILIPFAGPMALIGYYTRAMHGREALRDPARFPDFEFDKFGTYIERGVWPFLVALAATFAVMIPISSLFTGGFMVIIATQHGGTHRELSGAAGVGFVCLWLMMMSCSLLAALVIKPMMLRAALMQDFKGGFDFAFVKGFTARTWGAQLASLLFLWIASLVLMVLGMLALCVGIYAAMAVVMFAQAHLDRQLYELYLARGGEPVPVSPKLLL